MRLIALEEHYRAPMLESVAARRDPPAPGSPMARLQTKLDDLGENRLTDMDAGGIDVQVISHGVPGTDQLEPGHAIPLSKVTGG